MLIYLIVSDCIISCFCSFLDIIEGLILDLIFTDLNKFLEFRQKTEYRLNLLFEYIQDRTPE